MQTSGACKNSCRPNEPFLWQHEEARLTYNNVRGSDELRPYIAQARLRRRYLCGNLLKSLYQRPLLDGSQCDQLKREKRRRPHLKPPLRAEGQAYPAVAI
jgi:hypothetical protein